MRQNIRGFKDFKKGERRTSRIDRSLLLYALAWWVGRDLNPRPPGPKPGIIDQYIHFESYCEVLDYRPDGMDDIGATI